MKTLLCTILIISAGLAPRLLSATPDPAPDGKAAETAQKFLDAMAAGDAKNAKLHAPVILQWIQQLEVTGGFARIRDKQLKFTITDAKRAPVGEDGAIIWAKDNNGLENRLLVLKYNSMWMVVFIDSPSLDSPPDISIAVAVERARIVATCSKLQELASACLSYFTQPSSGATLPLTEGPANPEVEGAAGPVDIMDASDGVIKGGATGEYYTMEQVFLAGSLLKTFPKFRIGNQAPEEKQNLLDPVFDIKKRAFSAPLNPRMCLDWTPYARSECSISSPDAIKPDGVIDFSKGADFIILDKSLAEAGRKKIAYVVLPGVSLAHAKMLSRELNREEYQTTTHDYQIKGPFIFSAPTNSETAVTCYYHLFDI
ncbi:MAG: hypothetical protein LBI02_03115 [Opitutaceae bacterium]|jgi:hypothetical protein|nr:hypothetical protein [Opitutaceae bacterium]